LPRELWANLFNREKQESSDRSDQNQERSAIQLVISISEVDYSSIAEKKLGGIKGAIAGKTLGFMSETWKRNRAIKVVKSYKDEIIQAMNSLLKKEEVSRTIKDLDVFDATSSGLELEFHLGFDAIDYESLITYAYKNKHHFINNGEILELLDEIGDKRMLAKPVAKINAFIFIDSIVEVIVTEYEKKILLRLNDFAKEKELKVKFSKVEVRNLQPDETAKKVTKMLFKFVKNITFMFEIPRLALSSLLKFVLAVRKGSKIGIEKVLWPSALGVLGLHALAREFAGLSWPRLHVFTLTLVLFGYAAYRFIVWQQKKGNPQCEKLHDRIHKKMSFGLALVYFPVAVVVFILWLLIYILKHDFLWITIFFAYSFVVMFTPIFYIYLIATGLIGFYAMVATFMTSRKS